MALPPSGAANSSIVTVNFAAGAIIFSATLVGLLPFLSGSALAAAADAVAIPSFSDPALRLDRPSLTGLRAIRFLTSDDYPPLNFALPDWIQRGDRARGL